MTYKDMYDQFLDEIYEEQMKGLTFLCCGAAKLMEEMAPTDYRVGFCDWLDSITHDDIKCPECHERDIDNEIIYEASQEDTVQCGVCAGTHFECRLCDEVKSNDDKSETPDLCQACFDEEEKERKEEDESEKPDDDQARQEGVRI